MTETHQPPASVFSALKLSGRDSKPATLAGNSDRLNSSESPFSDELKRANSDVQKQVESHPDGQKLDKKGVLNTAGKADPKRIAAEAVEPLSQYTDASSVKNEAAAELAVVKGQVTPHTGDGTESTEIASGANVLVNTDRSDAPVLAKKSALPITDEQLPDVTKKTATETKGIDADLVEKNVKRVTTDPRALTQDAKVLSNLDKNGDSLQTTLTDKSLTASPAKSSNPGLHSSDANLSSIITTQPENQVKAVSADAKTLPTNSVQVLPGVAQSAEASLTPAQLPATNINDVQTPKLDVNTFNLRGALADTGVTSSTDLARSQALSASSTEEILAAPVSNPLAPVALKSSPGALKNQPVLKEVTANQSLSELVENQGLDSGVEGTLLPKQALQLAVRGGQGGELMSLGAGAMASEASSNMFQALPGGIITAPVVQRSEPSANLLPNAPFTVPLMNPDADESLASNVKWMMADGVKNAVVNLSPSGMGPISVQVEIENKQMNVSIIAAQGATREALDAMLPRLRDQLGTQNLESVRVDISDGRSENTRNFNGQQFGQARGEFSGNDQNNAGDAQQNSGGHESSETERQRMNEIQSTAIEMANGSQSGQSLFDAYV
ncbi:MAG: flagellar hook-length control protein FliK [Granulosicoccus sp.]